MPDPGSAGPPAKRGRSAASAWFALALGVIGLDQATKFWAVAELIPHRPVEILPFFNLTLLHNTGAAFSLLAGAGGWQRVFFIALTLAIAVALAIWLARIAAREPINTACLALILGGALGNLIDRVRLGFVIDFLDFHAFGWHWPAFNVADAAISCGAVVLVVVSLFSRS